jgi:CobQ/CobB/MinD/ParA nucleotide binding domain
LMRTIAFLTQKGGAGKTTLAASLAVAAAGAGERVIALDLDPQASLARWGKRREAANVPNKVMIDQLEGERLPRLRGEAEGRIRPQSVPADLPQFASERRGKRPNAPWSSSRAFVVCAHRFSGCDCRGPRCYRIRPREQSGAGNRGVLDLGSRSVGRVQK